MSVGKTTDYYTFDFYLFTFYIILYLFKFQLRVNAHELSSIIIALNYTFLISFCFREKIVKNKICGCVNKDQCPTFLLQINNFGMLKNI